jgi:hypothetical protein
VVEDDSIVEVVDEEDAVLAKGKPVRQKLHRDLCRCDWWEYEGTCNLYEWSYNQGIHI